MTVTPLQQTPFRLRLGNRLRDALPSAGTAIVGAFLWGLTMAASAFLNLNYWETPDSARFVALLYALGGAPAFPVGLTFATLVSRGRHWKSRSPQLSYACSARRSLSPAGCLLCNTVPTTPSGTLRPSH
ncbi:hypothetical protein [Mesorhizobium sp. WSM3860]|uniref:hypothetical protein n=1 Tax=Mesorhizobium sp. WSM3860 TaxID=2029403 RepID=UPI00269AFDDC